MSYTGADLFVDALEQYGVTRFFGNPGTTELPIMKALPDSGLSYHLGLHEDVALGMAAGYACRRRYHAHHDPAINPLGVVNVHVAPGMAHALGNLQNAQVNGVPLLATAGNHSRSFRHEEPILSGDMVTMTDEYTKWSAEVEHVDALPTMVRRAVRTALTPPQGPVFLSLPMDVMDAETDDRPERLGELPTAGRGDPRAVEHAAEALTDADEPVLVLGDHVARAGAVDAAVELAEATGAAVCSEMLTAEINFPPAHDQWVGFTPPDETVSRELWDTDTLVFVGCSSNAMYIPYEGDIVPDEPTIIQVGNDPWEVGKNEPADLTVLGDPGLVMAELAEHVDARLTETELNDRREAVATRQAWAAKNLGADDPGPERGLPSKAQLADALTSVAPDGFYINESNTSKYALLTRASLGPEQFLANKNGGLGFGVPMTVGAAVAERDASEARAAGNDDLPDERPVIGFIGDGSYLYYPQALYSAARYDLDCTVVVVDNRNYRILKDGMLNIYGGTDEEYEYVGMDIDPPVDIPANAESHGADGVMADDPETLETRIREAVETDGPVVVDAIVHD
ncbi:MAG: thiamine pyrophosphate-binding protein [Halolamina sp.]